MIGDKIVIFPFPPFWRDIFVGLGRKHPPPPMQTLLDWSVALSHSSCFSLLVLLDHCNSGSWFLPPQYIPNVLGLATFLIIFYITYQKKKKKPSHPFFFPSCFLKEQVKTPISPLFASPHFLSSLKSPEQNRCFGFYLN